MWWWASVHGWYSSGDKARTSEWRGEDKAPVRRVSFVGGSAGHVASSPWGGWKAWDPPGNTILSHNFCRAIRPKYEKFIIRRQI